MDENSNDFIFAVTKNLFKPYGYNKSSYGYITLYSPSEKK